MFPLSISYLNLWKAWEDEDDDGDDMDINDTEISNCDFYEILIHLVCSYWGKRENSWILTMLSLYRCYVLFHTFVNMLLWSLMEIIWNRLNFLSNKYFMEYQTTRWILLRKSFGASILISITIMAPLMVTILYVKAKTFKMGKVICHN